MDLSSFSGIVWRHKFIVVTSVLIALLAGLVFIGSATPVYEAQALILMNPDRSLDDRKSGDAFNSSLRQDQFLKTQVQIAQGDNVLSDVIGKNGNQTRSADAPFAMSDISEWLRARIYEWLGVRHTVSTVDERQAQLRDLRSSLKVQVEASTDLLSVSFRDPDTHRAQAIANQVAASFIDQHTRLYSNPQAARFFQLQEHASRRNLTEAEEKLRLFSVKNDSYATDEQRKLLLERRDKAYSDLAATKASVERTNGELQSYRMQLASLKSKMNLPAEIFGQNTFRTGAKSETGGFGDDPPLLHVKLYQESAQRLISLNAEIGGLKAAEQAQTEELRAINTTLVGFANQNSESAALRRSIQEAERDVELYTRRATEAQIANAWGANENLSNMQLVEQATLPTVPVFPRASLVLPLAVFVGAFAGFGLAMLAESGGVRRGAVPDAPSGDRPAEKSASADANAGTSPGAGIGPIPRPLRPEDYRVLEGGRST